MRQTRLLLALVCFWASGGTPFVSQLILNISGAGLAHIRRQSYASS
jgi:hypothetical protein